ncbi:class I SAM-dependent methyltransferase [Arenibaculum pallidiluteum]|uniref:class I SAM-dependent methyltransferase n=1 Tax=Arenibaculum pallidiluteum TaxID=2812559 RepID=UPI001A975137|nr:class I SAM-dependent methyltransferase [Arenibaculum pallidiluteum]
MTIAPTWSGAQGYAENADALAEQYESVTFEEVHRDTLHLIPLPPARIVDIGAGSGRDAAALARMGHAVLAVEPTPELLLHGQRIHGDLPIEWLGDGLPELSRVRACGERFDAVLLTAVWMHLDARERAVAMEAIAGLLAPSGVVVMSLRHGPVPAGRRMYEVGADETIALAAGRGLRVVHRSERDDMLGRPEVRWTSLGLAAPGGEVGRG